MKNRLAKHLPARGKAKKLPRGRYARVWLSPEYLTWCQRHHFKPPGIAACVLHTEGLRTGGAPMVINYHGPVSVEKIYDLPDDHTKEEHP